MSAAEALLRPSPLAVVTTAVLALVAALAAAPTVELAPLPVPLASVQLASLAAPLAGRRGGSALCSIAVRVDLVRPSWTLPSPVQLGHLLPAPSRFFPPPEPAQESALPSRAPICGWRSGAVPARAWGFPGRPCMREVAF